MKRVLRSSLGSLACGFLGLGCQSGTDKSAKSAGAFSGPQEMSITATATQAPKPGDPQPQINAMVHLDIYLLDLPEGAVSDNREFWKRVDEEALGVANQQRLNRNGIRCGIVPRSEGLYFSRFLDNQPHKSKRSTVDGLHTDTIKLELEKKFDQQDLFFFDASNQLQGRSYEQGANQLALTFGPTPRDPGAVRLTLCPVVHSEKTVMHFTSLNQEYETPAQGEDRLYDLGLTADLPGDSFMIIAPGGDAVRRTSIGACFLTKADKTEKLEQVIVIVPTFLRLDGKPMVVRGNLFNSVGR